MNKEKFFYMIIISILVITLFVYYNYITEPKKPPEILEISVITREPQNSYWDSIKQGIDKAAIDFNVDVTFTTLLKENDYDEQKQAIKREIENNTQAIIISPVSDKIFDVLDESKTICIEMESQTDNDNINANIFIKNEEMGKIVAEQLKKIYKSNQKVIIIMPQNTPPFFEERKAGFLDNIGDIDIKFIDVPDSEQSLQIIKSELVLEGADIIVSLDYNTLLNAAIAVNSLAESDVKVIGIDSTVEIVYYIEKGIIKSTVAPDTFKLGYLSVKNAVEQIKTKQEIQKIPVEHTLIKLENLFDSNNQRLLFPFIK